MTKKSYELIILFLVEKSIKKCHLDNKLDNRNNYERVYGLIMPQISYSSRTLDMTIKRKLTIYG